MDMDEGSDKDEHVIKIQKMDENKSGQFCLDCEMLTVTS